MDYVFYSVGRPYWGTQSLASRWREKTEVTEKKGILIISQGVKPAN